MASSAGCAEAMVAIGDPWQAKDEVLTRELLAVHWVESNNKRMQVLKVHETYRLGKSMVKVIQTVLPDFKDME